MWLCDRCQSINDDTTDACSACGVLAPDTPPPTPDLPSRTLHAEPLPITVPAGVAGTERLPVRERLRAWARWMVADARAWAAGRIWLWRAAILGYVAWAGWAHVQDSQFSDITAGVTMGIHELGHFVTAWAPQIVCAAMGSVFQVLAPVYLLYSFVKQREYFGLSVAGFWLSSSLFQLAAYVADARAQELPLVSLSHTDEPLHDWGYILGQLGLQQMDTAIGGAIRLVAIATLLASLAWGAWLCWVMGDPRACRAAPRVGL